MSDDRQLDQIIDDYLNFLDGTGESPDLTSLREDDRAAIERRLALLSQLYPSPAAPAIEDDPVFARMGFDRVGETIEIDGAKVKRARQRVGLDLNTALEFARNAGADLDRAALFQLENRPISTLSQADASALVAALSVSLADLESDGSQISAMRDFVASTEFEETVRRWTEQHTQDFDATVQSVKRELAASNLRATDVQFAHLLQLVHEILRRMKT